MRRDLINLFFSAKIDSNAYEIGFECIKFLEREEYLRYSIYPKYSTWKIRKIFYTPYHSGINEMSIEIQHPKKKK